MGVDIGVLVSANEISLNSLSGKTIAIDAYNALYQFMSSIRLPDGSPLKAPDGHVTSHIEGLLSRTGRLVNAGIKPVYVFDGIPFAEKAGTLEKRSARKEKAQKAYEEALKRGDLNEARVKARQAIKLTGEIIEQSKELLSALGLPWVQAKHEGEAQAAYMCKVGDVYAAASQDYDTLLFGSPLLVRNMTFSGKRHLPRRKRTVKVNPQICSLSDTLESLNITREQLVDLAILVGTDFNLGIKGIGPKKGLKLIRTYKNAEAVLEHLGKEIDNLEKAREIFLKNDVNKDYSIEFKKADEDAVEEILCEKHGFSKDRVLTALNAYRNFSSKIISQSTLDGYF